MDHCTRRGSSVRRLLTASALGYAALLGGGGAPAWAGDPIMPLSEGDSGVAGTGYSGVQGGTISPFTGQVVPPSGTRPSASSASARPVAEPLVVGGISAPVASLFHSLAARAGRALYVAPGQPGPGFPVQTLRPGASVAAAWSSGDISAS